MTLNSRDSSSLLDGHALAWIAAALLLLLGATGLTWIVINMRLDPADFDHPLRLWRHRLLVLHGAAACPLLWIVGTLLPRHQRLGWRIRQRRRSGLALGLSLAVLAASGIALYYPPNETARHWLSILHQATGAALPALLAWHFGDRLARHLARQFRAVCTPERRRNPRSAAATGASQLPASVRRTDP